MYRAICFCSDRVCSGSQTIHFNVFSLQCSFVVFPFSPLFLLFLSIAGRLRSAKLIIKRRRRRRGRERKSVGSLKEREKETVEDNLSKEHCTKIRGFEIQAWIESKLTSPCSGKWIKGSPSDG